jgi:hypothetical protein
MRADIASRHRLRAKQRRRIVKYAQEPGIKPAGGPFGWTGARFARGCAAGGGRRRGAGAAIPVRRKRRLPDATGELIRVVRAGLAEA